MFVYQVVVNVPLRQKFHYLHSEILNIGQQVQVAFRSKSHIGFILDRIEACNYTEYPIEKLSYINDVNYTCKISPQLIDLATFLSNYYHHSLSSTLFTILPNQFKQLNQAIPRSYAKLWYRSTLSIAEMCSLKSAKQQAVLNFIGTQLKSIEQLTDEFGNGVKALIQKLSEKELITQVNDIDFSRQINKLELTADQQIVYSKLLTKLSEFHVALLYGVTGSGKTEVFMHLIEQVLKSKKQVLVLIPEINLTPQLLTWFKSRFIYANIAILNSEVGNKSRFDLWYAAELGEVNIIIGTRLSVFTSFKNLGLIIVDEEHDNSFKQNDALRYNARDVAIWRAKQLNIPIVLASATPSMESLYNYKLGRYESYKLTGRAVNGANLPTIHLINTVQNQVNYAGVSQVAVTKLTENLARKELSLIYINRRGYAPVITCYDCGWVSSCRNCSTNMVYHHDKHFLKCHHCGYQCNIPSACPKCANQYLHTIGHGTQKLEQFLHLQFPDAKIIRVDRDTVNSKQAWFDLYEQINNGKIDIIVGTQMLAKGHNFANLTLVVGINLDSALFSYDFRASENMFQVLTQVSGRAGRTEKPGMVLLQTNYPSHPIYSYICNHDINGFIEYTQKERKLNNLPPYAFLVIIRISSTVEAKLHRALKDLYQLAKSIEHKEIELFFAVPAVLYKLYNRYRGQMLISSNNRKALHNYISQIEQQLHQFSYVTIAIDVDPLEV